MGVPDTGGDIVVEWGLFKIWEVFSTCYNSAHILLHLFMICFLFEVT